MSVERPQDKEIEQVILGEFTKTFIPRFDVYPKQLEDGTYVSVKEPFSEQLLKDHFASKVTLGSYALDEESHASYVCFDADDDGKWWELLKMAQGFTESRLRTYLELSRRGGHLWLFTPRIDGLKARTFALQLLSEWDIDGVEVFPKQNKLSLDGVGSFVRLPLGIHRRSQKRYYFVDLMGNPIAPTIRDQIEALSSPERVPLDFIDTVIDRAPKPKRKPLEPPNVPQGKPPDTTLPLSERIKTRMTVYQFVSQYVELDRNGRGLCPFHDDTRKSFSIQIDDNYWRCFADHCAGYKGSTIIDFWMFMRDQNGEDPSFKATLHDLAKKFRL